MYMSDFSKKKPTPAEIDKKYTIMDGTDSEDVDFNINCPKEHLVFELPDGRALLGLIEWKPEVKCDELVTVTVKMYLARPKKE